MTRPPTETAREVLDLLRSHGFATEATELENQLKMLQSTDPLQVTAARNQIKSMCTPRWLGDLFIDGLTLKAWWNKLEELSEDVG
jgi:hypothetical protein